jgi:hypothetical protein
MDQTSEQNRKVAHRATAHEQQLCFRVKSASVQPCRQFDERSASQIRLQICSMKG